MNSISANVYINKLDDTVNKCNNTYHSTIKMKPANIKSSLYIGLIRIEPFEVGDHVRISKLLEPFMNKKGKRQIKHSLQQKK